MKNGVIVLAAAAGALAALVLPKVLRAASRYSRGDVLAWYYTNGELGGYVTIISVDPPEQPGYYGYWAGWYPDVVELDLYTPIDDFKTLSPKLVDHVTIS